MEKSTKDKIIHSAAQLVQKKGYNGTGINDIIKHSGAPRGSIYYHFPDGKEQIILEAVKWTKENVQRFIERSLAEYRDATEAIYAFMLNSAQRFDEDNYFQGIPITALVLETAENSEQLRIACGEVFQTWKDAFAHKLISNGYPKEDANHLGEIVNIMLQGALVVSLARKNSDALRVAAEKVRIILAKNDTLMI